jgi:hypothetical protein
VIVAEDDGENVGAPAPAPAFVENNGEDDEMEEEPDSDREDGMLFNEDDA